MNDFLLNGILLITLVLALFTVLTDRLFTAVVYAGVLSATAAVCYLLLGAPDVALAEAVIGSTLSTVIFLVTLKKYRLFTVYVRRKLGIPDQKLRRILTAARKALQERDIEPHFLDSVEPTAELLSREECDLVIEQTEKRIVIHGEESSQYVRHLREAFESAGISHQAEFADRLLDRDRSILERREE